MLCKNCGTELENDVRFCPDCGEKIVNEGKKIKKVEDIKAELKEELKEELRKEMKEEKMKYAMNVFEFFKNSLLMPVKSMESTVKKLNSPKSACIFACILAVVMTILNFLRALFASFWVKEWSFKEFRMVTKFDLKGVLELDFFELLVKQLFIYLVFVFIIAGVFYLGTLIVKKKADFFKFLRITSVALIPNIVFSMIVAPVLQMLHYSLYSVATNIGSLSLLFILYEVLKNDVVFKEKDKNVWFYVICFSILHAVNLAFLYV